jgi:hypothetical protein
VTAGTVGSDQTICSGGDPAAFTVTVAATGSGALTYQWQNNTTGCGGAFSNIAGATAASYNPPAGLLLTTYYQRIVTSTLNGVACSATSNCITVTVNNVTGGTVGSDQTICSGGDPAAFTETGAATGSGALTYQWQSNTTGCGGVFSNIAGATATTYDPPAGLVQTTYYRRVVTSTLNGVACTAFSNCITVTINNVTPGTIAGNQTICSGGNPAAFTVLVAATGTGVLTYQWQSNTTGCGGVFSDIAGATTATYDPPAGLLVTTYYRRIVTSTFNGVSCTANSNCLTVTINNVTAGTVGSDQTICSGGDPAAFTETVAATGSGALSYQWQSNTAGCGAAFVNIVGATSATYDPPTGLVQATYYRRVVTSTLVGVACTANSNCITITINNVTPGTVGGNQTICTGEDPAAFTETVAATGVGVLTYQWQSNIAGCGAAFSDIAGATLATYDPPAGLLQTTYYRRVVTSTLNGVACTANSTCITVTINNVTPGTVGGNQTICRGGDPTAFIETVAATGSGVLTYQWQSNNTGCGAAFTNIAGATLTTYDPPAGLLQTTYYRRVVTSTLNGVTCEAISNCISATVTPDNTITLTSAVGTDAQTKCIGTAITTITYSTTGATGANVTNLPAGITGAWAGNVVTISGTPTASGTFNYTITLTGGCGIVTATGMITILLRGAFEGCLAPDKWPLTNTPPTANGYLDDSNVPCQITLVGSDKLSLSGTPATTDITHCSGAGTLTFNWSFSAPPDIIGLPVWHYEDQKTDSGNMNNNNNDSVKVKKPTNLAAGDLIIVILHFQNTPRPPDDTAGFKLISYIYCGRPSDNLYPALASFYKIATGNEPSYYNFGIRTSQYWYAVANRVTGYNTTTPICINTSGKASCYDTPNNVDHLEIPSVDITYPYSLLVAALTVREHPYAITDPSGMTNIYFFGTGNFSADGAIQTIPTAGATGPRLFDWSITPGHAIKKGIAVGQMFAINPTQSVIGDDSAFYLINGDTTFLSRTNGTSGSVSIPVNNGDQIGFRVSTHSNTGGPGKLTIYNLSVPNITPVITCPANKTVNCEESTLPGNTGTATAANNCGPAPVITYRDVNTPGNCPGNHVITRTWIATNNCGDSSTCNQSITVHDIMAPVIASCPSNLNAVADPGQTYATISLPAPVYSDNCTALANILVAWTMTAPTVGSSNGIIPVPFKFNIGTTSVIYTFTDACGNVSTCSFSVTVGCLVPTITLGSNPSVCSGTTSANLTYSATTGSPDQYSIVWSAAALVAGFANVTNAALPPSPIILVVPAAAPVGTYNGTLTIINSITGCASAGILISVTVLPSPSTSAIFHF